MVEIKRTVLYGKLNQSCGVDRSSGKFRPFHPLLKVNGTKARKTRIRGIAGLSPDSFWKIRVR
jgi:hypothetical protein